jgi:succinate-semialdehyde dehydrogenase/glutarate-semialdehyde dehydrogenase
MTARSQYRDLSFFVAGAWTEAQSGDRMEASSPATGALIGTVPEGDRVDVGRAVAAATKAWRKWAGLSVFDRARAMRRVADTVVERRDDLALTLTLDQGKPLHTEAYAEVDELVEYFRMAAEDAIRLEGSMPPSVSSDKRVLVYRVPRGVVGVITPWNWPYTMPGELLAPALASGNSVVWVPAPSTSICAVKLSECIAEADLPPGVFNMVTGPGPVVGDELAGHPGVDAIGFIGSIATGHAVAARAAGKALLLEMGGNGPLVILDDADLSAAAGASLEAAFLCAGQSCTAGERWLVHESIHDAFVTELRSAIERGVRLGDPIAEGTTLGPLNNESTAAKMDRHVANALEEGAGLVHGGRRAEGWPTNLYYEPTVIDGVTPAMEIATEETFGPVVPISTISDEREALALIRASPYGLLTAVWTGDLARALRFAEAADAGWVNINESTNYWESHLPFGGLSRSLSGVGRVGGRHALESFTELKTVVVNLGATG